MVTATFSHGDWGHVIGNLVFFFAFAAAVEVIIGPLVFLAVVLVMIFGTGSAYSAAMMSISNPPPTVGLSGVVMGIIAMLAYLQPTARIRCLYWVLIKFGTVAVSAWILAAIYIGLDVYTLAIEDDLDGVNLIAHVNGAMIGIVLGVLFFRRKRRELAADPNGSIAR